MSDDLTKLSATRLAALIRARAASPVEIVEAHLNRISAYNERLNPKLNAIVTLAPDVVDRAREAEAEMMRGDFKGTLHGVPVTIKDTFETKGLRSTSGSLLRAEYIPDEDATAVARLKAAGAILLGKTNVPEMAIPYECDNPVFGRTFNPHNERFTSGGSSGGEAAAISACLSPLGLGSDLSGSIRVPAHFCGIVGLKPTTARVSIAGHFPPAIGPLALGAAAGPMARCVADLSLMLKVLSELNTAETLSVEKAQNLSPTNMRGWHCALYLDEAHTPVTKQTRKALDEAVRALRQAGLVVMEEKPPGFERAMDLWTQLFSKAAAIQLRGYYPRPGWEQTHPGSVVRNALLSAEKMQWPSLDEFVSAWMERDALRAALVQWMKRTPLIIAPVGAVTAFEHGERRVDVEGKELSVFRAFSYSRIANALDLPAVSVPAGVTSEGLPVGVQIIGRPLAEETVLAAASIIEEALGGYAQPPA